MNKKYLLVFVILAVLPLDCWATSKTVCDSGCDNTTIAAALSAVGNGNHTITVQGTYTGVERPTVSQSGDSNTARLLITASGTQSIKGAVISGDNVTLNGFTITNNTTPNADVEVTGDNVTISNNSFVGHNTANVFAVYTPNDTSMITNLTISGNTFETYNGPMLYLFITNSTVSGNTASHIAHDFINLWGHDVVVSQNTVSGCYNDNDDHVDFIQTHGDGGCYDAYNITVERNFMHSCDGTTGGAQPCNLSKDACSTTMRDWTFRNNIFFDIDGTANVGIQYTYWYNNTFYHCAEHASDESGPNTAIGAINCSGGNSAANVTIKNNIFINHANTSAGTGWYDFTYEGAPCANIDADYNYVANLDFTEKTGFSETHGVNGGDPHISNLGGTTASDYSLTALSTILIDHGYSLSPSFSNDYAGTTRSGDWDIGAYEATDTVAPSNPTYAINTAGSSFTVTFSEAVTHGAGGTTGWVLTSDGGAVTAAYSSGEGSTALVYQLSRTVYSTETITGTYTQPTAGITDIAGNDFATVTDVSITNNSTATSGAPTYPKMTLSTGSNVTLSPSGTGSFTLAP